MHFSVDVPDYVVMGALIGLIPMALYLAFGLLAGVFVQAMNFFGDGIYIPVKVWLMTAAYLIGALVVSGFGALVVGAWWGGLIGGLVITGVLLLISHIVNSRGRR